MNLPKQKEAKNLVTFIENNETFQATQKTYDAWIKMKKSALNDGINLILVSAFRSIERQQELVEEKRKKDISENEIFSVLARPGYSEHHTGRALDLHSPGSALLEEDFENTEAFLWLQHNGNKYGFYMSYPRDNDFNIVYEPWHWCFHEKISLP